MIKNRFFVLTAKPLQAFISVEISAIVTELFKHELRRQNVFGQN
jgi:hypothetical protein